MTLAEAIAELEAAAEMGQVNPEVVKTVSDGLTLIDTPAVRKAKHAMIVNQLTKLEVGPLDVLTMRVPQSLLDDPAQMRALQAACRDIAEVAKRGVVIMHTDTPMTVETLPAEIRELLPGNRSKLLQPPPAKLILPPGTVGS